MKELQTVTTAIKKAYGRNNILEIIKSLENPNIFMNMRLVQRDELVRIKKLYFDKGYLSPNYKEYLITLHFNFVKNNFKYEDNIVVKVKKKKQQHIGILMLNNYFYENICRNN